MFKSLLFILAEKFQKLEIKKHPGILRISGPIVRRPKIVTHGEGKGDALKLVTGR